MSDVSVLPGQAWLAFTRDHNEDDAVAVHALTQGAL